MYIGYTYTYYTTAWELMKWDLSRSCVYICTLEFYLTNRWFL